MALGVVGVEMTVFYDEQVCGAICGRRAVEED